MNKKLLIGIIIVLVIAAAIGGYFLMTQLNGGGAKNYRVGILSGDDAFVEVVNSFKAKMAGLGYEEGKNIEYDLQKVNNDQAGEQRIAKNFVTNNVDLIFAFPTDASVIAKESTLGTKIPVLFSVAITEGNNLIENVRQPGGNITGVRFPGPEMAIKRLELLHELLPQAKRIYITWDKNYPSISYTVDKLRQTAPSMSMELIEVPVTNIEQIKADLNARAASSDAGIDAILIMPTLLTAFQNFVDIAKIAGEHNLPVVGIDQFHARAGAVFSYAPNLPEFGSLAAPMADKILKGNAAGKIPVITPEGHLLLNYKLAQKLGITVPQSFLIKAEEIIR